jgi:hypothetical protein
MAKPTNDRSCDDMPVLPEGVHPIDVPQQNLRAGKRVLRDQENTMTTPARPPDDEFVPSTSEEWIINHIRKLENAVDDILFALKAGSYRMMQGLPLAVTDRNEHADLAAMYIVDGKSCDNACPCYGTRHMHRWFEDGDIRDRRQS